MTVLTVLIVLLFSSGAHEPTKVGKSFFWLRVYPGRILGPVLLKLVHNNVILGMTHASAGTPTKGLQPTEEQCQSTGRE